jgi:hypothetical protein
MTALVTQGGEPPVAARLDAWLLGSETLAGDIDRANGAEPVHGDVWQRLKNVAVAGMTEQVAAVLRRTLPHDLVDLLLEGLDRYDSLRSTARATLPDPTARRSVVLGDRTLHAVHVVDIFVDATVLQVRIPVRATVAFTIVRAEAQVVGGRLGRLVLADPRLTGTVTAYGQTVTTRDGVLRIGGALVFDPPRPILSEDEERAALLAAPPT